MDSLLANYASSDEEEQEPQQQHQNTASNKSYSKVSPLFSALPHPKSSSLFSSLPKPKPPLKNPNPPLNNQQQPISNPPKRIVQFKPPINPFTNLDDEEEEDNNDKEKERKKPRETESLTVTSFLSSIPAPKNSSTLGGVVPSSGSGRRSILETQAPPVVSTPTPSAPLINESGNNQSLATDFVNYDTNHPNCETAASYGTYDHQNVTTGGDAALSYGSYENYGSYGNYGNDWGDGSASMVPQTAAAAAVSDSVVRVPGKRRRNEIPMEIVEVKQDELMKDRPREDQVKLTGIAFGPSYQPVSSTKGKPSKLHKRKHQIGTLYYDMKQKEMELSERRAKGFLTKAETQAKYGW